MAKMKALRSDEDLAAVPIDQPVLVDLDPSGSPVEIDDLDTKPAKTAVTKDVDANAGANVLQQQLDALKAANVAADRRAQDAERRAEQADRERIAAVNSQSRTEADAVQSGLAGAQSDLAAAKMAVKQAGEAGDWEALAEANSRVGRAAADIREFERSAALLADRKDQEPQRQQVQNQPIDIMSAIDSNPQLLPTEKEWLKAHPEAYSTRNKELDVAYDRAMRKGLSRGTSDYFDFMNEFMGYAKPQVQDADMSDVSAPVHRNERGGDGRPANGKIMLTPQERDMAKSMGVSDIEYARQKVNFEAARKIEPAKYGDR